MPGKKLKNNPQIIKQHDNAWQLAPTMYTPQTY
jgi:hypothetical protein